MIEKTVVVSMSGDAEERPVAVLVQIASRYESKVYLSSGDKKVNAKSTMGTMSMSFVNGENITVIADGEDEAEAVKEISEYLEK